MAKLGDTLSLKTRACTQRAAALHVPWGRERRAKAQTDPSHHRHWNATFYWNPVDFLEYTLQSPGCVYPFSMLVCIEIRDYGSPKGRSAMQIVFRIYHKGWLMLLPMVALV